MELQESILKRRSIRKFTDEPVSKQDLIDIVKSGMNAPSGCNAQCWKFVVLTEKSKIDEVAEATTRGIENFYKPLNVSEDFLTSRIKFTTFFRKAPAVILVFLTDMEYHDKRVTDVFMNTLGYSHEEMIDAIGDPEMLSIGACIQNMLLTITEKGLGACWQADPTLSSKEICEVLNISEGKLVSVIPVGVPAQTPREKQLKNFDDVCTII